MSLAIIDGHVVDTPAQPLTLDDAEHVVADLALRDIYVSATLGPVVVIEPLTLLTTRQEAQMLGAFHAVTDCRLECHVQRPTVDPACLLCSATDVELQHELCGRCAGLFRAVR